MVGDNPSISAVSLMVKASMLPLPATNTTLPQRWASRMETEFWMLDVVLEALLERL